ncbi:MAG: DNA polymerase III subunit delta [Chloroflexota bacterium]|nr:DNA polymerase III subunit delta [Chloroflexota bacterium]
MANPTPVFYIFHGDDDLTIDAEVANMSARMGDNGDLNTRRFDGEQTSVSEIMGAALAFPFLSDKRLVIVRDLLAWLGRKGAGETGKKAVELLTNEIPNLPDWTRLVFVEREKLPEANKLIKLARSDPRGYEKNFSTPDDSADWIIQRARTAYNVAIDPHAASALAAVTTYEKHADLRRADSELFKLWAYTEGQPITEAHVALLTPYSAEAGVFAMVDALAERRADRATALLHQLLDQGENIFGIYANIVRTFRLMLLAREALDTGKKPGDLAAEMGMKSTYPLEKAFKQAKSFSLVQLETIYRRLRDYDRDIKTGVIEPLLALDLLIAGLGRS